MSEAESQLTMICPAMLLAKVEDTLGKAGRRALSGPFVSFATFRGHGQSEEQIRSKETYVSDPMAESVSMSCLK